MLKSAPAKLLFSILSLLIITSAAFAEASLKQLAEDAISEDRTASDAAIKELRNRGYEGLNALLRESRSSIEAHYSQTGDPDKWNLISHAIDSVARQKDAWASGLYWHTDLDAAKAESARTGKPIISLRLLGNLDEELSCANSRFFRAILYTDPKVSSLMRNGFVLHWRSQRPAPVMTVDYGNGRKLVTTITGNSIHYVLNSKGEVLDALPGLYSPNVFSEQLRTIEAIRAAQLVESSIVVRAHQTRTRNSLLVRWRGDLELLGNDPETADKTVDSDIESIAIASDELPSAVIAAPRAVTKFVAESSLLRLTAIDRAELLANTDFTKWRELARLYDESVLSEQSIRFIRLKADPKGERSDSDLRKMSARLAETIALDTVRNQYLFRTNLLGWLTESGGRDLDKFNERIYSELFLTPDSDAWLGLYSPADFNGIAYNGVVK
ncbi:MAG: hypothetical protein DWQ47_06595 [Acidobacteria bacterium]|nr:MAG: hypothetical protein DWQ32_10145 [Acidobacteriota bacterium]REK02042.1 MAG: hypothetical protein DWQ38_06575 [Acidobacteriota bacterium]REK15000.1 MAG: hypothetical protein DWQ43_15835 [Acidobacteriota bacterium]REK45714.1 MAG: hypothetical protein DWQ47_06595 [Acidobacteriota bacterium]